MLNLISPAVRLMQGFRISHKVVLVATAFAIPLFVVVALLFSEMQAEVAATRDKQVAIQQIHEFKLLQTELRKYRAFMHMQLTGNKQVADKIDGLNFAPLKKEYDELYNYRTLVKRDLDKTKKALEEYKDLKEPVGVRTVAEIRADLDRLETTNAETTAHNEKIKTLSRDFEDLKKENERKQGELADVIKTLEVLEAKKDKLKKELEGIMDVAAELKAKITASVEKSLIDSSVLKNELEAATNAAGTRAKLERKKELESEVEKESLIVAETNEKMAAVKEKKEAMLKAFNLPVPNLSIADDIYIDEIPFDNISQAKKIELSMALAIAQKPTVKIIMISDGSLFDEETLAAVKAYAAEKDFQLWIERVANTPSGNAVFIEDGEIKAEEAKI